MLLGADAKPLAIAREHAKHPAMAMASDGTTLISWVKGSGWNLGGDVNWVVLDSQGNPTSTHGSEPGVPAWGLTAAYAEGAERFVILR